MSAANSNLEPIPARVKVGRDSYGSFYLVATEGDYLWGLADGPVYIRADIYEAELDKAMKREVRLRRELVRMTKAAAREGGR